METEILFLGEKEKGKKNPLKLTMNISSQKLMTKNLLPLFGPGKNIKMSLQSSSRLALYLSTVLEKRKKRNQEMTILWGYFTLVIPVWGHFTSMWQSRIQIQGLSDSKISCLLILEFARKIPLKKELGKGELAI